ncbi:uncharacterized protein LOC131226122 [Magnolia sinica]|uniref:uncharacterized protein LOC131226122 n=1 Tax=Magnolia sinica TaxID=86752 RepID=UPI0026588BBC|nr:uncharacterized protein LOC131226122 [Magnolia sinica]
MQATGAVAACGLFEHFQHLHPLKFAGAHRPEEAEYWLDRISKMIRTLYYSKAEQVKLVTYMFKKDASLWWDSVLRTVPAGFVWTWDGFKAYFHEKYFPLTYHNEKDGEFLYLKQGGMIVVEYENCFTELARYALLILANEPMRMRRFSEALLADIRTKMFSASIHTYVELVNMSLRAKQDGTDDVDALERGFLDEEVEFSYFQL